MVTRQWWRAVKPYAYSRPQQHSNCTIHAYHALYYTQFHFYNIPYPAPSQSPIWASGRPDLFLPKWWSHASPCMSRPRSESNRAVPACSTRAQMTFCHVAYTHDQCCEWSQYTGAEQIRRRSSHVHQCLPNHDPSRLPARPWT